MPSTAPARQDHSERPAAFSHHAQRYGSRRLRAAIAPKGMPSDAMPCAPGCGAGATWRDTCLRRVVGWHLDAHLLTKLVLIALEQALNLRQPAPSLLIHADRGSPYTSSACRVRIGQAQALASFTQPGNPYANAQAEAGWSTLKTELLPMATCLPV